MLEVCYTRV